MTASRVCEMHGIDIYGRDANVLDWRETQERQVIVAERAQKEKSRVGDLQLSREADQVNGHFLFRRTGVISTLYSQRLRQLRRPPILMSNLTKAGV